MATSPPEFEGEPVTAPGAGADDVAGSSPSTLDAEQAALRRVATLVARELSPEAVFTAVAREVGESLGFDAVHMGRYETDDTVLCVAQYGPHPEVPVGARFPARGESVTARVLRSGRPARMNYDATGSGVIAERVREVGIRASVGVPISVEGRTWGVMIASVRGDEVFPPQTESHLERFTELVATALSNASAHARIRVLADEQAALRRVATLVARQAPESDLFALIAEEIGRLLGVDSITMVRFEPDRTGVVVASEGPLAGVLPTGTRAPLEGHNVAVLVFRTGRGARMDDDGQATGPFAPRRQEGGARSVVGAPIVVEGRLWGAMIATTSEAPPPADTESRIGQFTELMGTAIANAEARGEIARLAAEQAALRRVATLVAQGAPPSAVFDAVTTEAADVLGASGVALARYEDGALAVLARAGDVLASLQVGQRMPLTGDSASGDVLHTGRAVRVDHEERGTGPIADFARGAGIRSTVAAPVVVDGRTWGAVIAGWTGLVPPPDDTESRMASFAELLDTAIANADSRAQLTASRARVLAAGDDARRRVVRDLHDGAQQRLVHTIVTLKLARRALEEGRDDADALLAEALEHAERATAELRELAHGILPSVLTRGGLRAGVEAFADRLGVPVDVDVADDRLPAGIEASAYFVVAEALTNVAKHAGATRATVRARVAGDTLTVEVGDDGVGGADPRGHGLLGIADRVEALGGRMLLDSAAGRGTVVRARLPLPDPASPAPEG